MLTVITTTWIGSTGGAGHAMLDSKVPPHRWAIHARSELGMVQIDLTGGDATLQYDRIHVLPSALEAAQAHLERRGDSITSVTVVEWQDEAVVARVLSRVDVERSELYAGMATF